MMRRSPISVLVLAAAVLHVSNSLPAAEPVVHRENIEWTNLWVPDATKTDLPRVLLLGDSICNAYYEHVAPAVKGKAYVAKMATSSAVGDPILAAQIKTLLTNYKFAVIHFNVGLHGFDYSEDDYRKEFPKLVAMIKDAAPDARLIWATSTPMRKKENLHEFTDDNARVKARNQIVVELAAQAGIPVNDLYAVVENHPEFWAGDGVHFKGEGQAAQAQLVTKAVLDALKTK